ncbi:transposase family protein [Polynucleobacter sp. AM-25C3]|nr:transposase family protein [Polynucleobacter sp. AM-25C3]
MQSPPPTFSLLPANILNLAAYEVCKIDSDDHNYHIEVVAAVTPKTCQACDSKSLVDFGRREQLIKDIPSHGKRVGIYIDTRRFQCRSCNKTFYEVLPELDAHHLMTSRLVSWIGKQAISALLPVLQRKLALLKAVFAISFATTLTSSSKPPALNPPNGWVLMRFI